MGDTPLQRAQPGDSFTDTYTAAAFNIFADSAETLAKLRRQFAAGQTAGRIISPDVATIRNDTGADLARFSIVGLGDPIIDNAANLAEFQNRVTFKGGVPDIDYHAGKFAILAEPIGDGRLGKGIVCGVTPVQIDVTDAAHAYADIADGASDALASGDAGAAQILWKETGTGDGKWAIVRLGPPGTARKARWIRFVFTADLLYTDLTATADVLEYWDGADPDPDDEGLEVRNCAISGGIYLFRGNTGGIGLACYNPEYDRYHIVQPECP